MSKVLNLIFSLSAFTYLSGCTQLPNPIIESERVPTTDRVDRMEKRAYQLMQKDGSGLKLRIIEEPDGSISQGSFEFSKLSCGGTYNFVKREDDGRVVLQQNMSYGRCVKDCLLVLSRNYVSYRELCRGRDTGGGEFEIEELNPTNKTTLINSNLSTSRVPAANSSTDKPIKKESTNPKGARYTANSKLPANHIYQRQIELSIKNNDIAKTKEMIRNGATIPNLGIEDFITKSPEMILFLLENGYTINDGNKLYTQIFERLSDNRHTKIKIFLSKDVPTTGKDKDGRTTIYTATQWYLLRNKEMGPDGEKAYKLLLQNTKEDLNKLSLERGPSPSTKWQCRPIDLGYGIRIGTFENITKWLIEAGTDLDQCSCMNKTPLMNAVDYGDIPMIKYMLKKNADINHACGEKTALDVVRRKNSTNQKFIDIEMMLMKSGAKSREDI